MPAPIKIPRYPLRRRIIRFASRAAFELLTDFRILNRENLPPKGPLIVVGNHFHFADPVVFTAILPTITEYIAGTVRPAAPKLIQWLPEIYPSINVHRGGASTDALRQASSVLEQGGIMGIFPEAGAWASVLRRARPGVAFLAATTGTPLLPIGIENMNNIFPDLKRGRRATVTVRIGRPFGPFHVESRGRQRRVELEKIGDLIMAEIAALIPPEKRGLYSDDPELVRAAEAVAAYPFD